MLGQVELTPAAADEAVGAEVAVAAAGGLDDWDASGRQRTELEQSDRLGGCYKRESRVSTQAFRGERASAAHDQGR